MLHVLTEKSDFRKEKELKEMKRVTARRQLFYSITKLQLSSLCTFDRIQLFLPFANSKRCSRPGRDFKQHLKKVIEDIFQEIFDSNSNCLVSN